jgi:hypothetical protein
MRVARSEPVPVLPLTGDLTLDEGPAAAPPAN